MATVGGGLFDNNICSSKSDNGQKIHKNNNNNDNNDNDNCRSLRNSRYNNTWLVASLSIAIWSLLTLTTGIAVVQGAAVYSNLDFLSNPNFEPICSEQQERFIESEGKESSLLLEFNADDSMSSQSKSCKRILSAPSSYGFIVRLILPKIRSSHLLQPLHHGKGKDRGGAEGSEVVGKPFSGKGKSTSSSSSSSSSASTSSAMNEMTSLIEKLNSTALKSALGRTCPLSIFSSLDPHTPQWRVDPCQLEDTAPEMEDPVRLFHGRVRIVWEHGHNSLDSKLMVTVLGKGDQCRSETKHQCLKIGDEPILCISKDLICDGIRHCPYSNEYDSDEDYTMCWKRRRFGEPLPAMESDIFEHFALEVFRNLFAFDVPAMPGAPTTTTTTTTTASPETSKDSSKSSGDSSSSSSSASLNSTTLRKVDSKKMASAGGDSGEENATTSTTNVTEGAAGSHRRNSTRLGLNSDLSKYGPWGYLMLGMLLCGGALLICGLWASASQHAANNERESSLAHGGVGSGHNNNSSLDHQSSGAPPNYEELDPPPPYSVLFPNQKAASSTTLSSIGNAAAAAASMTTTTALPGDNAANRAANSVEGPATTTTTTRVQLEAPASSSSSSRGGAGSGGSSSSSSNSATTTQHVTQ